MTMPDLSLRHLTSVDRADMASKLNALSVLIFADNFRIGWWDDSQGARDHRTEGLNSLDRLNVPLAVPDKYLIPTKLALAHSELSEALEGFRKNLMDDHLPNRPMIEVELADTIIRILDLAGYLNLDIGGAVLAKLAYNAIREDHKREVRAAPGGKSV